MIGDNDNSPYVIGKLPAAAGGISPEDMSLIAKEADLLDVASVVSQHLHSGQDEASGNCIQVGESHWYYYTARMVNGMYEWRTFDNTATDKYVYTEDNRVSPGDVAYAEPSTTSYADTINVVSNDTIAKSAEIKEISNKIDEVKELLMLTEEQADEDWIAAQPVTEGGDV